MGTPFGGQFWRLATRRRALLGESRGEVRRAPRCGGGGWRKCDFFVGKRCGSLVAVAEGPSFGLAENQPRPLGMRWC